MRASSRGWTRLGIAYLDFAASGLPCGLAGRRLWRLCLPISSVRLQSPIPSTSRRRDLDGGSIDARAHRLARGDRPPSANEYAGLLHRQHQRRDQARRRELISPFGLPKRRCSCSARTIHNSVNGIREIRPRRRARQSPCCRPTPDLRLDDPRGAAPRGRCRTATGGLFAFPAQSNFSGVKHKLRPGRSGKGPGVMTC